MTLLPPRLPAPGRFLALAGLALVFLVATPGWAGAAEGDDPIIIHVISSLGWVFGPMLLIISTTLVALIVLLALDLRMTSAIPPGFVDEFTDTVNKRKFKEAFDMARNDPSFLGRVLTAGMSRLQYGLEDAREAAMNTLESIKSDKEQKNNYTAVIASIGPMVGLVGTVFGMIGAFQVLGHGENKNAGDLAKEIAKALSITLVGIGIAVPGIFFNAFYRNRITRVTMDVGHIADDLLTQMYHNSKKPGGPPAGPGGSATGGPAAPAVTAPTGGGPPPR